MARFDPRHYPDRLALDAHMRQVRARELRRLAGVIRASVGNALHGFAHGVSHLAPLGAGSIHIVDCGATKPGRISRQAPLGEL
jgi:hypothetical protein